MTFWCPHCGETSHGFACAGLLGLAPPPEPGPEPGPEPARTSTKGQSGPPKPLRPPRRIDPRSTR